MSNNGGSQSRARSNGRPWARQKLARRLQTKEDPRRSELLARILEESSSIKLNEQASQWNARQAIEDHTPLFDLIAELRVVESKINPDLPTRDERSWSQFIKWYSSEELKLEKRHQVEESTNGKPVEQVRLFDRVGLKCRPIESVTGDDTSDEYSLNAKVPFKRGETIFEIDRSLMLTTETAMRDLDLSEFIKMDSIASGMPNVVLVLHLLNEYSKGERSRWWPYLSILPNKILPILQMDKKQISSHLVASANLHSALKMLRAISRQYSYFYKKLQSTTLPIRHKFTLLLYTWGVSIVCSRQNEIPHLIYRTNCSEEENLDGVHDKKNKIEQSDVNQRPKSVHALIPVLDMCNHDPKSNQATYELDTSRLEAAADLSPNQEITLNYGCRSSGDFFIHNGFVPDEVSHDTVGIILTLNQKHDHLIERRVKLLKTYGIATAYGVFTLRSKDFDIENRCDPRLTMFLIATLLDGQEIGFVLDRADSSLAAVELYERVHHACASSLSVQQNHVHEPCHDISSEAGQINNDDSEKLNSIANRLSVCVREHLSRRASVGIALIDRSIENLGKLTTDIDCDSGQAMLKFYVMRLLEHERRVYEDYLIK